MSKKKIVIIELSIIAVLVAAIVVLLIVMFGGKKEEKTESNSKIAGTEEKSIEYVDADEYFGEMSKSIKKINVNDSKKIENEQATVRKLNQMGFDECEINTNYTSKGDYIEDYVISETSSENHPVYQAFYTVGEEETWVIYVTNGQVTAYPIAMNNDSDIEIIVSEKEEITGYDNIKNVFYEIIPLESEMKVVVVDEITPATLEKLTREGIR